MKRRESILMNKAAEMASALAGVLGRFAEREWWREGLNGEFARVLNGTEKSLHALDELVKEFQNRRVGLDDLRQVYKVWKNASRYLRIKKVAFKIHGRGYDMYDHTSFGTIEELEEYIRVYNIESVFTGVLAKDFHQLIIKFE